MAYKTILFGIFAMALFANHPALACPGLFSETQTFLTHIPENADEKQVIAKIKLTEELKPNLYGARVVTALKGIQKGAYLKIEVTKTSCSRDIDVKIGETYFIAGDFDGFNVFRGEWKGLNPDPYWKTEWWKTIYP